MTPGAIAARQRRNSEWEAKRFNVTMREYIEIKYDNIYTEYCTFYESLAAKHPNKKNLLRTSTFKSWRKAVIEETFREDGVLARVTDLIEPSDEDSASEFFNNNDDRDPTESTPVDGSQDILSATMNCEVNEDSADRDPTESTPVSQDILSAAMNCEVNEDSADRDPTESTPVSQDILSAAMNEALARQHLLDIDEIQNIDNIIAEIIGDLERDDAMQEILAGDGDDEAQYIDDEGIALDYETELEAILEPFDYELEVDF